MSAKQDFGVCEDLNLSNKNSIQLCFFQRELKRLDSSVFTMHCRKYFFLLILVQTMGAVCAFDQGHVYVDDNEISTGHPKSVVALSSKYTYFSLLHGLFSAAVIKSFICQDQSATPVKHHKTETADYKC